MLIQVFYNIKSEKVPVTPLIQMQETQGYVGDMANKTTKQENK